MWKVLSILLIIVCMAIGIALIPGTCYLFNIMFDRWWLGVVFWAVVVIVGASERDHC